MSTVELLVVIVLLMALAYGCGSWLGALSVCRLAGVRDPRLAGSRNPGFSNVLRLHGGRLAMVTLALDATKGMPAVWLAKQLMLPTWAQGLVGLCVLLGHSYPLWYRFRGGKAVASAFGVLLVLTPWVALLCAGVWALLAWRAHTAALASLAAACVAPLASWWLAVEYVWVVCGLAFLVIARHFWNIRRLGDGNELSLEGQFFKSPEE